MSTTAKSFERRDDRPTRPTNQTTLIPGEQSSNNLDRRMLRQNFESPALSRGRIAAGTSAGTHKLDTTNE